jgi:hypothetical protein
MANLAVPDSGFMRAVFLASDREDDLSPKLIDIIWDEWMVAFLIEVSIEFSQIQGRA